MKSNQAGENSSNWGRDQHLSPDNEHTGETVTLDGDGGSATTFLPLGEGLWLIDWRSLVTSKGNRITYTVVTGDGP